MTRLKANKHMLYVLKAAHPKMRKLLIKHVHPEVIKTISEIAYNTLNGNNKISVRSKNSLCKYKKELRSMACLKGSVASKRKIILQRGAGFLPALLGTVLSGIIGAYLNKQ